ncbi:hypothetical protein V1525DRAFT_401374 [Lipomyces kononenkoae]|uniref:Uncharacterized protein n=1 Tax=Lipomyces kononenkoae TaxID=34357 RepID=A0ACC3T3S5_LIPKO
MVALASAVQPNDLVPELYSRYQYQFQQQHQQEHYTANGRRSPTALSGYPSSTSIMSTATNLSSTAAVAVVQPRQISPSSSTSSTTSSILTTSPTQISTSPTSTRSFITPPPPPPPHLRSLKKPLYRPAVLRYGTSLKVNGEDWSQQLFWGQIPSVTGPPRRNHWVADDSVTDCQTCRKTFTFWDRRHHCRRCGHIFCAAHSSHLLRLDQNCNFHPSGTLSRTCDSCATDFSRTVIEALNSRGATAGSSASNAAVLDNINRITNLVRNSAGGRLPFDNDVSDDDESDNSNTTPNSNVSTPTTLMGPPASSSSYFYGSGTTTPEVIEGLPAAFPSSHHYDILADSTPHLSRQIQLHLQQQLGGRTGLTIPHQPDKNDMPNSTPSDRNGSYVPTDWNWSTF